MENYTFEVVKIETDANHASIMSKHQCQLYKNNFDFQPSLNLTQHAQSDT